MNKVGVPETLRDTATSTGTPVILDRNSEPITVTFHRSDDPAGSQAFSGSGGLRHNIKKRNYTYGPGNDQYNSYDDRWDMYMGGLEDMPATSIGRFFYDNSFHTGTVFGRTTYSNLSGNTDPDIGSGLVYTLVKSTPAGGHYGSGAPPSFFPLMRVRLHQKDVSGSDKSTSLTSLVNSLSGTTNR